MHDTPPLSVSGPRKDLRGFIYFTPQHVYSLIRLQYFGKFCRYSILDKRQFSPFDRFTNVYNLIF